MDVTITWQKKNTIYRSDPLTFKCQSDGVLTPTLTWYQPARNEIFRVTNKEITVQVGVNNNSNCSNCKYIAEYGPTPSDEDSENKSNN